MGTEYFKNEALRSFWSVHVEAWRRSGLSKRKYCRQHRLSGSTFDRWLRHLIDAETLKVRAELRREERRERLRKKRSPVSKDQRCRAVQAFWAMHVEAMRWCGMGMQAYARAHGISQHSLRRWRDLIDANEVEIDWRTHLHPSARPLISTSASSAAKESITGTRLTDAPTADPPSDGRANRRRFSDEEKLAIVRESEQPGATAADVCRRHGIVSSMLFRWRVQFGFGKRPRAKLVAVNVTGAQSGTLVLNDLLQPPDGMTVVELDDGRRVFALINCGPEAVRRHVAEREIVR
ncbi:transposase-like protein [Bradyrhizobium sp. LM6.10]